ncbi:MAG: collagen binding domain-containing protein, partial [Planctomycetota bacterium]
ESGSSARSLTSEDGSFCLYLPQKSSYRLETGASFEFMAYEESDSSPAHPPGTRDIKIVLQKTPSRNLYVVDAETSAPIQQFGIGPSGDGTKWPEIKNHPNGEYKLSLAPFARFAVFAPGYAPKIASVPALNDNIIVRMLKPGKLVGKANFNNKACAGLVIEVAPAESERRDDNFQSRVIDDAQDGRFAIDGLPPGIYNLYLRGRSTAPRRLTRLQIVAGATVDVGEVNLEFAGSIRGELLVDDKFSGKRLTVELNNNDALNTIDREYETIGGGTFSFTALEASEYLLTITYWVESENGGSSSGTTLGTRFKFKLRSGEDKKITIDMRSNNSANFTILTNAANRPVYWPIVLFHPEDAQFPERNAGEIQSGGAITGTVPPGRYTIKLYSQWFIPLARTGIINLLKDHKNEIVIDAMVGGLIVELPKDKNIYEVGEFPIRLDGTYNNEPWTTTITLGGTGTNSFWLWPMDPEVGRRFSINEIPPGRVKLFVNNQKDPIHEIDIRAGETSTREIPAPAVENK